MADPKKINFNPINSKDQPTLAEDLEWNFDQIREFSDDLVATKEAENYQETFTATSKFDVIHGLDNSYPQVTVFNSAGVQINTLVTSIDANTIRLNFTGTLTDAVVVVSAAQV